MLNVKKTAIAVLAFSSCSVFAGTMGPVCAPGNVTVPCATTAWDFAAQALYLKPSLPGASYMGSTANSPYSNTFVNNGFDWDWGFKLEGSYHFSTGNDLTLNWYHFDNTTNSSASNVTTHPFNAVFVTANGSSNPKWDAVNLEFGQASHFGEWKNIRFHGGVQYVHIEHDLTLNAQFVNPALAYSALVNASADMKFNGFGPRVGVDYLYNWGNGIGMYANGAGTLLVGTQSFNDSRTWGTHTSETVNGSVVNVVPELEAKLGLTYTYAMAQGDLSLDLGWMWVCYMNAMHHAAIGYSDLDVSGSFEHTVFNGSTMDSNFAVQGPFVGLKWVGNIA